MSEPKFHYRISTKEGNSTDFHILDFTFIPESNFVPVLRWYNENALKGSSAREIETLLNNIVIRKKNKKLLDNRAKSSSWNSKSNPSCLFGWPT